MKLTIFGATGRIGGHLLNWAVDVGHDVHVLARSPEAVGPRDGLTVTGGDVLDPAAVAEVISGADAVLSAVGPKILDNFRKTELLAPESWIVKQIQPRIFARTFADVRQMERVVKDSDLDWTLVRPARLVSDPGKGEYRVRADSSRPAAARSPVLTWRTSSAPRSPRRVPGPRLLTRGTDRVLPRDPSVDGQASRSSRWRCRAWSTG